MGAVAVGGFILGPPLATFLLEIEGIRAPFFDSARDDMTIESIWVTTPPR